MLASLIVALGLSLQALPIDTPPRVTTPHFRFFGDDAVANTVKRLADSAEERLRRLCVPIGACERLGGPIDVWVAENAQVFAKAFPEPNPMSEWAAGVTFQEARRIVLRAAGTSLFSVAETFDHEVAHVLQYTFQRAGQRRPRWFAEGLAVWQSGEGIVQRLESAMRAASTGHLLSYEELAASFPNDGTKVEIAYAQSALFVRRLALDGGPGGVIGLLHDVGAGVPFEDAFRARFNAEVAERFAVALEALDASGSPFYLLWDGNFLWGFTTLLFLFVAWRQLRGRKRQIAALADAEDRAIAAEDLELARVMPPTRPADVDDDRNLLN